MREGVIINSRTQDNYYHNQQPGMQRNRSVNAYNNPASMLSPGSNNGNQFLPPRHQNFGANPPGYM